MSDSRALLQKISALRQRLAQNQGHEQISVSAKMPAAVADSTFASPIQRLEQHVATGSLHHHLLESSLRVVANNSAAGDGEKIAPTQLTARAGRLLHHAQALLKEVREIAACSLATLDDQEPLAVHTRETLSMIDTVVRTVGSFPNSASAQLRLCEGLEVILAIAQQRLALGQAIVADRQRLDRWQMDLSRFLSELVQGHFPEIKPLVFLADEILTHTTQAAPMHWFGVSASSPGQYVAAHCLNVAQVVARIVRHDPNWSGRAIDPILAALLHDAGMLAIPPTILSHGGLLSRDQWRTMESHTLLGAELSQRLLPGASWLTEAMEGHHERLDGTGYPHGLRDTQVRPMARLIACGDVYAAIRSNRPYRPARDARTALTDTLLLAEQGLLDRFQAEQLLQLSFYPVGTVVELSDGALALVVANHSARQDMNAPARPAIAILTNVRKIPLAFTQHLDLAECDGRSIVRSLSLEERREMLGRRFPELG